MDNAKSQLIERLKAANTVLITVSRNPSVDQLAACIGLTLVVNKLNKHGSAVFSGEVPSTIEFLKPEDTLEKTTNSLRDFIIALDKNKADKLRYKVEDQLVKIFITPYRTSLSQDDLEFSQGDFNVDLIIALGVKSQEDLDQAIVAHGRILHDATVACINNTETGELGNINWFEQTASSLCELVTDLCDNLGIALIDQQIATALLTGIIAETDRFSNQKTTPQTMSISSKLMAAGANQQLVASNLSEGGAPVSQNSDNSSNSGSKGDNGTLSISHPTGETTLPEPSQTTDIPEDIDDDDEPSASGVNPGNNGPNDSGRPPRLVSEPPSLGGTLTANSTPEQYDPASDPLSAAAAAPSDLVLNASPKLVLNPDDANLPPSPLSPPPLSPLAPIGPPPPFTPPPPTWTPPPNPLALPSLNNVPPLPPEPLLPPPPPQPPLPPTPIGPATPFTPPPPPVTPTSTEISSPPLNTALSTDALGISNNDPKQTLKDLEQSVNSPHITSTDVNSARSQVDQAIAASPVSPPEPSQALNAMPLGGPLHESPAVSDTDAGNGIVRNTTGLDPSLFSEVPPEEDKAPPVPPPVTYPLEQLKNPPTD